MLSTHILALLLPTHAPHQDRTTSYVALHYADEAGRPQKLRASPEHLVYLAPRGLAVNQPAAQLPPGGAASRADMVRVGDLLAVRSSQAKEGGVYVARVTAVTRWGDCCRLLRHEERQAAVGCLLSPCRNG